MKFPRTLFARSSVGTWTKTFFAILLVPQVSAAQVVITEIMYDLPGSDSKAEWVEIRNIGAEPVDISKWKFNDGSSHALNAPPKNGSSGSLTMAPGAFLILASDAATFRSAQTVNVSIIDTVMSLANDGGSVSLMDASSTLVDTVSYSKASDGTGLGESLQKVGAVFLPAKPTPGAENSSTRIQKQPEPVKLVTKSPTKAAAKKTATKTGKIDTAAASTSRESLAVAEDTDIDALAAAAAVPIGENGNAMMPWAFGALAAGVAGAGAVFVTRQKKNGEWEIEEIA